AGGLSDDRVKTGRHGSATGAPLATDEIGIIRLALNVLKLALDRGLIADEHQSPAVSGRGFSRRYFGTKRNPPANDAMSFNLRLIAGVVGGIDFPNVRRVRAFALLGIGAELEIIIALFVCAESGVVS